MSRALILMYHSIAAHDRDPFCLRVDPRRFDEHLQLLTERYRLLALQDLVRAARDGKVVPGSVGITFDDGYADNFTNAVPILSRHGAPSTVLVTTGFVAHERPYWWERLEELFLGPVDLPEDVDIVVNHVRHRWHLARAVPTGLLASEDELWRAHEPPRSARHEAFLALTKVLKWMPPRVRDAAIDEVERWAGHRVDPLYKPLTTQQLRKLAGDELVDIGAHTVWHPLLPAVAVEEQRSELINSKAWLESTLDQEIQSFAYPDGAYDEETRTLVAESGFTISLTTDAGTLTATTDPLSLPRLGVENWPADVLERYMNDLMVFSG